MRFTASLLATLAALVPFAGSASCGGIVLDLGPPDAAADSPGTGPGPLDGGGPDSDTGPGRPGPDGGPATQGTLATDGYEIIPYPDGPGCTTLAGTSAADLWCAGYGQLHHWDGARWSAVQVPSPTGTGDSDTYGMASAAPGELWFSTSYGLAHVRASGASEDLTAELPPIPQSGPGRPTIATADGHAFLGWPTGGGEATTVYAYDGARFVALPVQNPVCPAIAYPLAASGGVLWALCGQVVRDEGTQWTTALAPIDHSNIMVTKRDYWAMYGAVDSQAVYCPDWCHANQPPYNQATTQDWRLVRVAGDDPTNPIETHIGLPPDLPRDGSVKYEGRTLLADANDRLALIGCVTPRPEANAGEHMVIHAWDGSQMGAGRSLPPAAGCPSLFGHDRPLADGTWVFSSASIVLVRP